MAEFRKYKWRNMFNALYSSGVHPPPLKNYKIVTIIAEEKKNSSIVVSVTTPNTSDSCWYRNWLENPDSMLKMLEKVTVLVTLTSNNRYAHKKTAMRQYVDI